MNDPSNRRLVRTLALHDSPDSLDRTWRANVPVSRRSLPSRLVRTLALHGSSEPLLIPNP